MTMTDRYNDLIGDEYSIGAEFRSVALRGAPGKLSAAPEASVTREGAFETRTTITHSGVGGAWPNGSLPYVPDTSSLGRRVRHVGDLFRRLPATEYQIQYVREINVAANESGASAVAEGDAKPEQTLQWEGGLLPRRKIAAWVPANEEIFEDADNFVDIIDRSLMHRLFVRESDQILNGDGDGENLTGLRHVTGVQSQAYSTSVANTIALALAAVENVDGVVDGIAIDPSAYEVSRLAAPAFWNDLKSEINVVPTAKVGANKAMVGAFQLGGVIREKSTSVRWSDSHSDYFVKNKLAFVAERREALIVDVPRYFVDTALQ